MDSGTAAILGTILGVFVGSPLTYYFSTRLIRKQEYYKAASIFRSAFTKELRMLQECEVTGDAREDNILASLNKARIRHENALIRFRPYLKKTKQISIDQAWKEYCHPQGGDPNQMPGPFDEYFIDLNMDDSIKLAISKIEALLEFAKFK